MQKKITYVYLFLTFFIWGSVYVVSKYAMEVLSPFMLCLLRYVVSVIGLGVVMKVRNTRKPVKKGHWKYFFIVGGLGYFLAIALQIMGTNMLDSSLASLINSMNPVVIPILAMILLKEKVTKRDAFGIALSMAGVFVILGFGNGTIRIAGVVVSVVSVVIWSWACVTIRKISEEYDPVQIALYGMMIALLLNIPAAAVEWQFQPSTFTKEAVLSCIYLGVMGTAVAHTLWNVSLKRMDASVCSRFYPLQPLTSAVLGIVVLHEVITRNFVAGSILICAGVLLTLFPGEKPEETETEVP